LNTDVLQNIRLVVMTALKPSHFYLVLCFPWAPLPCVVQSQRLFLPKYMWTEWLGNINSME